MLLMKEPPMIFDNEKYQYLLDFSKNLGFFIYQGKDGRTLMHRDVVSYKDGVFGVHDLTYETFLGQRLFSSEAVIIPPSEVKGRLFDLSKESGLLSHLNDFTRM